MKIILDIETDGLLDSVSKIHCVSYLEIGTNSVVSLSKYDAIITLLQKEDLEIWGHNIIRYDIPVLEKILGISISAKLVDTLALSWYLYPKKLKHGLEYWGDSLGVKKPEIKDWENLTIEEYIHRCESDVKINYLLYEKIVKYLDIIYENNHNQINSLIKYLSFKLDCAKEQEDTKCKIDLQLVNKSLEELNTLAEQKISLLQEVMPLNIKYKDIEKPKKPFKQDGSLSSVGCKWFNLLEEQNLPADYEHTIQIKISEEKGNPNSSIQIKDWLYSLGWIPINFEYRKNKSGEIQAIPQIYINDEVCPSIKNLYSVQPALENLDMLSLIRHRQGVFKSFLENIDDLGYVRAKIAGITPTFRFKHSKPLVNLPKVSKFYGEQIRGALIIPDDTFLMCGSDMSSLESTTQDHYMYFFDSEYVQQKRVKGFDAHTDIAILAGLITKEEEKFFKWYKNKG